MSVICAMLKLQAEYTQNEKVTRIVQDTENKIYAMSLVHQHLYKSQHLSRIDLHEYLGELSSALEHSHSITSMVSIVVDAAHVSVLIDTAIPCGLVITELVSNACKHAFPDKQTGEISIRLSEESEGVIHLRVADNGIGVPDGFDFRNQETLGLQTVFAIVEQQLQGTILFSSEHGVCCDIQFTDTLYTERV